MYWLLKLALWFWWKQRWSIGTFQFLLLFQLLILLVFWFWFKIAYFVRYLVCGGYNKGKRSRVTTFEISLFFRKSDKLRWIKALQSRLKLCMKVELDSESQTFSPACFTEWSIKGIKYSYFLCFLNKNNISFQIEYVEKFTPIRLVSKPHC